MPLFLKLWCQTKHNVARSSLSIPIICRQKSKDVGREWFWRFFGSTKFIRLHWLMRCMHLLLRQLLIKWHHLIKMICLYLNIKCWVVWLVSFLTGFRGSTTAGEKRYRLSPLSSENNLPNFLSTFISKTDGHFSMLQHNLFIEEVVMYDNCSFSLCLAQMIKKLK